MHQTVCATAGDVQPSMHPLCATTCHVTEVRVCNLQIQRCSLELTLPSLLHASVGLSEHGAKEFLSDSNMFVVYLEHMVSKVQPSSTECS